MHWDLAVGRPSSNRPLGDAQDLGRLCNIRALTQFGNDSPSNRCEVDIGLEFSKLYGAMTALQKRQIHGVWTFTVRSPPVGGEIRRKLFDQYRASS